MDSCKLCTCKLNSVIVWTSRANFVTMKFVASINARSTIPYVSNAFVLFYVDRVSWVRALLHLVANPGPTPFSKTVGFTCGFGNERNATELVFSCDAQVKPGQILAVPVLTVFVPFNYKYLQSP